MERPLMLIFQIFSFLEVESQRITFIRARPERAALFFFILVYPINSLTSTILPVTAAAAAVKGLASMVRALGP